MSIRICYGPEKTQSTVIKKCHHCGEIIESSKEIEKCHCCSKGFLPSNYFGKVHAKNTQEYRQLYLNASDLHQDDLIKGLAVLW